MGSPVLDQPVSWNVCSQVPGMPMPWICAMVPVQPCRAGAMDTNAIPRYSMYGMFTYKLVNLYGFHVGKYTIH